MASTREHSKLKTIHAISEASEQQTIDRDRYYYSDITELLGIQRTAINKRIRSANIKPHADENNRQAYLDVEQFEEFKRITAWVEAGNSTEKYQGRYHVSEELFASAQPPANSLAVQSESFVAEVPLYDEFMRNAIDEISMNDRLKAYAAFETYHLLNKTISDKECIELIGWKPPRSGFREGEYKFLRAGNSHYPENGNLVRQALWRIEKHSTGDFAESERLARKNHQALKEVLRS